MLFKMELIRDILKGRKHQTRRNWKKPMAKVGGIYKLKNGYNQYDWGKIRVTAIKKERLCQITDEDAKKEGCDSREDFINLWKRTYGKWDPDLEVTVLDFELVYCDLKPGDLVIMQGYSEEDLYKLKVWTIESDPFYSCSGCEGIFLKEFPGYYAADGLVKVEKWQPTTPEDLEMFKHNFCYVCKNTCDKVSIDYGKLDAAANECDIFSRLLSNDEPKEIILDEKHPYKLGICTEFKPLSCDMCYFSDHFKKVGTPDDLEETSGCKLDDDLDCFDEVHLGTVNKRCPLVRTGKHA